MWGFIFFRRSILTLPRHQCLSHSIPMPGRHNSHNMSMRGSSNNNNRTSSPGYNNNSHNNNSLALRHSW